MGVPEKCLEGKNRIAEKFCKPLENFISYGDGLFFCGDIIPFAEAGLQEVGKALFIGFV